MPMWRVRKITDEWRDSFAAWHSMIGSPAKAWFDCAASDGDSCQFCGQAQSHEISFFFCASTGIAQAIVCPEIDTVH